jgi:hypothetical protein
MARTAGEKRKDTESGITGPDLAQITAAADLASAGYACG